MNASTKAALLNLGNHKGGGANAGAAARGAIGASGAGGQAATAAGAGALAGAATSAAGAQAQGLGQLSSNDYDSSLAQANLQAQQNAINQQGQLGFTGLGQQAQQDELQAQTATYESNVGATTAAEGLAAQEQNAVIGGVAGAASGGFSIASRAGSPAPTAQQQSNLQDQQLAASDVKLKEPGGPSGWTIREEPNFLLAKNDRTGELRKLATEPLSKDEQAQAAAPHGAGLLGSTRPDTLIASDLPIGSVIGGVVSKEANQAAPPPAYTGMQGFQGNQVANYGGTPGGANAQYQTDQGLASTAASGNAPTIANANLTADQKLQTAGLNGLAQTAAGGGAAIAAANGAIASNTASSNAANTAVANSASGGGRGLAAAGSAAKLQNAQATGGIAGQQAVTDAGMQAAAQSQYASDALGMQSADSQAAAQQATLQQQQQSLNQQGQLGYLGLGVGAENAQLGSQSAQYAATQQAQEAQNAQNQSKNNAIYGGLLGIAGAGIGAAVGGPGGAVVGSQLGGGVAKATS